jgi:hypothetical protein
MSNYRPITDIWFLARAKLKGGQKYYGAYLGGFPERARALLGCRVNEPVLHVCGGKAKLYPYKRAFGKNDKTLDLDPSCEPDFLADARDAFPFADARPEPKTQLLMESLGQLPATRGSQPWAGVLIDPPYSEQDAAHYLPGADKYPKPNQLIRHALDVLPVGGRVGIIHYILPSPPPGVYFVAAVGIFCGYNNRIRSYSVFERTEDYVPSLSLHQPGTPRPTRKRS